MSLNIYIDVMVFLSKAQHLEKVIKIVFEYRTL